MAKSCSGSGVPIASVLYSEKANAMRENPYRSPQAEAEKPKSAIRYGYRFLISVGLFITAATAGTILRFWYGWTEAAVLISLAVVISAALQRYNQRFFSATILVAFIIRAVLLLVAVNMFAVAATTLYLNHYPQQSLGIQIAVMKFAGSAGGIVWAYGISHPKRNAAWAGWSLFVCYCLSYEYFIFSYSRPMEFLSICVTMLVGAVLTYWLLRERPAHGRHPLTATV